MGIEKICEKKAESSGGGRLAGRRPLELQNPPTSAARTDRSVQ